MLYISNLIECYDESGNYENVIKQYKILIVLQENKLGPEAFDTLISINNLGLAYYFLKLV